MRPLDTLLPVAAIGRMLARCLALRLVPEFHHNQQVCFCHIDMFINFVRFTITTELDMSISYPAPCQAGRSTCTAPNVKDVRGGEFRVKQQLQCSAYVCARLHLSVDARL